MRTIEITRIEDVRAGDDITLTRDGLKVSGRVRPDDITLPRDGRAVAGRVWPEGTAVDLADWHVYFPGIGTLYARDGWTFVSATREVPEWETGMAGTATVGPKRRQARAYSVGKGALVEAVGGGYAVWSADDVHSFVPDDASRWAAQAKLVGIDRDNARAEVERWKAEAEMLTAKVDRLMPLQEHENECAYRQRAEKAEAEVERLSSARALPGYLKIEEAISQGFELDCNLTFEGGIPPLVIERVMAEIIAAREDGE